MGINLAFDTRTIKTRFMKGLICSEMYNILAYYYSNREIAHHPISFEDAIYSQGFINAVERGLIPEIYEYHEAHLRKQDKEYHHIIDNDTCYVMYFKEIEDEL